MKIQVALIFSLLSLGLGLKSNAQSYQIGDIVHKISKFDGFRINYNSSMELVIRKNTILIRNAKNHIEDAFVYNIIKTTTHSDYQSTTTDYTVSNYSFEGHMLLVKKNSGSIGECWIQQDGYQAVLWDILGTSRMVSPEDKIREEEQQQQEEEQREKQEQEAEAIKKKEETKRKKEEAEKLRLFLVERKSKVYDYKELNPENFNNFKNEIEGGIKLKLIEFKNVNYSSVFTFTIDTSNVINIKTKNFKSDNPSFENFINGLLKNKKLDKAYKNNYPVSSSFDYSLIVKGVTDTFSFHKITNDIQLSKGNAEKFEGSKRSLENDLNTKSLPMGKYVVAYSKNQINGNESESVQYIKYKGLGGSANCLFSFVVPGLGNQFVNKKKKSTWLITTIGVGSLIGAGFYENSLSKVNYQKYKDATKQSDIDSYYDKANLQNKLTYNLIGIGACWWVGDIITVYIKGARNKKASNEAKSKINLAMYPSMFNNTFALGINLKF